MKNKYFDMHGTEINNGDILRFKNMGQPKHKYAPPEPFIIFIQDDDKCELYISGMDEFQPVEEWQTDEDKKENKISAVEIFAPFNSYRANFISKQNYDCCLTFAEIEKLNEIVQKKIKEKDYGFVPVMHIVFEIPDKNFEEYQEIKTCCIHDITKAIEECKKLAYLLTRILILQMKIKQILFKR